MALGVRSVQAERQPRGPGAMVEDTASNQEDVHGKGRVDELQKIG